MKAAKTFSSLKSEYGTVCKQDNRPSAASRGYGRRWQRVSKAFLRKHPLCECQDCKRLGEIKAATVVDHKIPHKGDMKLFWNRNNWQAMAKECHDHKTAKYDGAFGRGGGVQISTD